MNDEWVEPRQPSAEHPAVFGFRVVLLSVGARKAASYNGPSRDNRQEAYRRTGITLAE